MNNCWAHSIGGCSAKISREHVVSKSIFVDDTLNIAGVAWLSNRTVALSKKALAANVLCTTHNSELSNLDAVAQNLSAAIRNCFSNPSANSSVSIDGYLFERWCLKMLLGLLASGWTEGGKIFPTKELVEIAFGTKKFQDSAGLYFFNQLEATSERTDIIKWNFLLDSVTNTGVCGIIIVFSGLICLLTTRTGNPEPLIQALGKTPIFDFTNVKLFYHPKHLSYEINEIKSHLDINFTW